MQKKHRWRIAVAVLTFLGGISVCQAAPHEAGHKALHRISQHTRAGLRDKSASRNSKAVQIQFIRNKRLVPARQAKKAVFRTAHGTGLRAPKNDYMALTPTALRLMHLAPIEFAGVGAAPQHVATYDFKVQSFPAADVEQVTTPVFVDHALAPVKAGMVTNETPVDAVIATSAPEQSHLRLALAMLASHAYHWARHPLQALESGGDAAAGPQAVTELANDIAQEGQYAETDSHSADHSWLSPRSMVLSALKFIGAPYRWGGMSPSSGFDCSGFVKYILAKFDIKVPRTAYAQASELRKVSRVNLKPGDLVFFDTLHRPYSHVGIYIGHQHFVSAQTARTGVQVASLKDPYWAAHFDGARSLPVSNAS
ncbi:NLP/P60 protein [Acidithiobacillus ferrivorans SS3]|uniref:NLP/P60 protein n=2 Tax=Acidithiobacillus ferrivorans TaxID=160808 RepID=G0JPJ3_9PROT|nr:C40 family peptidase [Acidithiobacillus ferrivorans]AEM48534.1 NLP/P60 protein [Acidithiobacillus ferrivorans SS3]OFA15557.1 hydrolase Nlp/P60 [Acidithiobacillus ferrivorans]